MAVRRLNPTTPGQRFRVANAFAEITASKPEKSLLVSLSKSGGRNNQGKITSRYIGGGHKRRYRIVDFKRNNHGVSGEVLTVEYDPNRSAFIALIQFGEEKRYIIAPAGLKVGQKVEQGPGVAPEIGNALPLAEIPAGVAPTLAAVKAAGVPVLAYGSFISVLINFIILAFIIFMMVRQVSKLTQALIKEEEAAPAAPAPTPEDILLLREIRDSLKK